MHINIRILSVLALTLSLAACTEDSEPNDTDNPIDNGIANDILRPIASDDDFVESLTMATAFALEENASFIDNTLDNRVADPVSAPSTEVGANANNGAATTGEISGTYVLSAGVDELDKVKYNGDGVLFIAPSRTRYDCCFEPFIQIDNAVIMNVGGGAPPNNVEIPPLEHSIRILATDTRANATRLSTIPIAEEISVEGMYLRERYLITVGASGKYARFGDDTWTQPHNWFNQSTELTVYDVGDLQEPQKRHRIEIEGGMVESRLIGEDLYLILRYVPPRIARRFEENIDLENLNVAESIPTLNIDGESLPLFSSSDCLVTHNNEDATASSVIITSVLKLNINDLDRRTSRCFLDSANGVYLTADNLYLYSNKHRRFNPDRRNSGEKPTRIHRFSLSDNLAYRGSLDIIGHLWSSGQADFRLYEKVDTDGGLYLYTFTTEYTDDDNDRFDHYLSAIEVGADSLRMVGQLPNNDSPAEIGKVNENLFAARFYTDTVYAVTFEETDPLYVIDISDPTRLVVEGALAIPGVSEFIHPVNDDLILGIGRQNGRVKAELFDVSDHADPSSVGSILIGDEGFSSWSDAVYNRHSFTYLANNSTGVHRFAIPATVSGRIGASNDYTQTHSLYQFEIDTNASGMLTRIGVLGADPLPSAHYYGSFSRSRLNQDAVFFIYGSYVWSGLWGVDGSERGPL